MGKLNRREFLRDTSVFAGALAAAGLPGGSLLAAPTGKKGGKGDVNETLRIAVIGVNGAKGRGMTHVHEFAGNHTLNCTIATICDADEGVIGSAMKHVESKQGKAPKFEQDLGRVMDDKSIDIVTIATPNHWHALAAIWALQSGKDVYVEKPVSHNVSEGRRIVEAARKYNRICQTGTQSRSNPGMRRAMEYLHSGKLGQVKLARGLCYKKRGSIGKSNGAQPVPTTVNFDLWTGPAPMKPLMRKRLHYDWHWVWDTGNGDIGNQGIHEMDKARWGLGKAELPRSVRSLGGRFGYEDDGQTPNTLISVYDFGDCELIFEVRGLPSRNPYPGKDFNTVSKKLSDHVGNVWYCAEGTLIAPSYSKAYAMNPAGEVIERFEEGGDHFANFIKAVRSRKSSDLNADILEGHISSALCHLGNVSYRLGSPVPFSKDNQSFGDDKEAHETIQRMAEHLKENRVALESNQYHLGRKLTIDPQAERFVSDTEADQYLTREYRKPFVVPEKV